MVPESWALLPPGSELHGWVGRDCRSGAKAPGKGPAAWTAVKVIEWLWSAGPVPIACGVLAEIKGTDKRVKFADARLLRRVATY